jgi:hypothetical protein
MGQDLRAVMLAEEINDLIKVNSPDTNFISDGYHTFGELYEHRIELYILVCKMVSYMNWGDVWRCKKHSDGTEMEGWFLLGINKEPGEQITYHIPMKYWDDCKIAEWLRFKAPEFDGHTPDDVLKRLHFLDPRINPR